MAKLTNSAVAPETLALVKREVTAVEKMAAAVVVNSSESLTSAVEILGRIKTAQKALEGRKTAITKPINAALKEVRSLFAPFEHALEQSESFIKTQMMEFKRAEDRRVFEAEAKIRALAEANQITPAIAEKRLAAVVQAPTTQVQSERGTVQFRTVRVVEIIDVKLLPREYLMPDMPAIRTAALAGVNIPGVTVKEETQVAAR